MAPKGQSAPDYIIAPVSDDPWRVAQALAMLRDALGQAFITDERFAWYAATGGDSPYRAALAATDATTGAVVGALTVEIVDAAALRASFMDSYTLARAHAEVRALQPGRTGLIKSIAVAPEQRGRGVARALIARGLAGLAAHGAERSYSLAWESARDGCLLCGTLAAAGFARVTRLERFWYQDSVAQGYVCPACGHPCVCAAWVIVHAGPLTR